MDTELDNLDLSLIKLSLNNLYYDSFYKGCIFGKIKYANAVNIENMKFSPIYLEPLERNILEKAIAEMLTKKQAEKMKYTNVNSNVGVTLIEEEIWHLHKIVKILKLNS